MLAWSVGWSTGRFIQNPMTASHAAVPPLHAAVPPSHAAVPPLLAATRGAQQPSHSRSAVVQTETLKESGCSGDGVPSRQPQRHGWHRVKAKMVSALRHGEGVLLLSHIDVTDKVRRCHPRPTHVNVTDKVRRSLPRPTHIDVTDKVRRCHPRPTHIDVTDKVCESHPRRKARVSHCDLTDKVTREVLCVPRPCYERYAGGGGASLSTSIIHRPTYPTTSYTPLYI